MFEILASSEVLAFGKALLEKAYSDGWISDTGRAMAPQAPPHKQLSLSPV